jgi:hypothetical protein
MAWLRNGQLHENVTDRVSVVRSRRRGVIFIVLAIGPKVCVFRPGRERWNFKGDKNPLHVFLRRGSKAVTQGRTIL